MSSVRELKSYKAFRYFCSKPGQRIWFLTNDPKFSGSKGCVKRCQKETAGRGKQFGVLEIILHLNIELKTLYMYSKNLNTIVFRMSDTVIRLIERRSVGDKYILVRSMPSPSPFPCWPLFSSSFFRLEEWWRPASSCLYSFAISLDSYSSSRTTLWFTNICISENCSC